MGKGKSPTVPLKGCHRLMKALVGSAFGDKGVAPRPEEFDKISVVFQKAGGSWERLFTGSIDDMTLLRKTLQVAIEKGMVTKKPKWGG